MARQLQIRRGTTAENNGFIGAEGELTYDTERKLVRVHDGSTLGGKIVGGDGGNGDALKNQNLSPDATDLLYNWEGTLEEYNEQRVAELHPEWICLINDDVEPTQDATIVYKETDDIISGQKTFTKSIKINPSTNAGISITNLESTADIVPTQANGRFINFLDQNGQLEGYLEFYHSVGDDYANRYIAINVCKDGKSQANIALGYDKYDNIFTRTPTMPIEANDDGIATTRWTKTYSMGIPDWANKYTIGSGTTIPKNGYVFGGRGASDNASASININGNAAYAFSSSHSGTCWGNAPVAVGDVVTFGAGTYYFVPSKYL